MSKRIANLNLPYLNTSSNDSDMYPAYQFELRLYVPPKNDEDNALQSALLDVNGIPNQYQEISKPRHVFRIGVSQFNCFFIWQAEQKNVTLFPMYPTMNGGVSRPKRRFKAIPLNSYGRDVRKSCQLAIRSLYALGYDVGVVDIGVFPVKPRYRVLRLSDVIPNAVQRDLENIIQKQYAEFNTASNSVLGADLEFVLRHKSGSFVLASNYLSKLGKVGYDAIWLPKQKEKHPIAELRPQPHSDPLMLFRNIYSCLQMANHKINRSDLSWLAGGHPLKGFPIGGHIHFSQIPLTSRFIRALDNYLTLPLFLMESPASLTRRSKYGFLGDVREQFHGGFEYRTPPSWLVRPRVAKGILSLSKVLTLDYKNLIWMPTLNKEVQFYFYKGKKEEVYSIVELIWNELRQCCPSYANYQKELDQFYELIESGYEWNEFDDIRRWWQIGPS